MAFDSFRHGMFRPAVLATASVAIVAVVLAPLAMKHIETIEGAMAGTATMAMSLFSNARLALAPDGQPSVTHLTQVLQDEAANDGGRAITIDIWFDPVKTGVSQCPEPDCRALLLYTPGSGQSRTDNALTAAALARYGYVVVALDDVERAPETVMSTINPLHFDFSSEAANTTTLRMADDKTHDQAARLIEVLERLTALQRSPAMPAWLADVSLERVGAFGWSLGGATAAEASLLDGRIVAVANLDGWLFGRAARGGVTVPYLLMMSDYPFPDDAELDSPIPERRYEARLTRRDLEEERRLLHRPGNLGIRIPRAVHENLSDLALSPRFWRSWFRVDPVRTKSLIDGCLKAFFDHHLRQAPRAGCLEESYAGGAQRLKTIEWPGSGIATAPI